jgi:hypothetical protein
MVRLMGSLAKGKGVGQRHLIVYWAEPLVDFNKLTHHLLQIILTHLKHTRGPIPVRTHIPFQSAYMNPITVSPTHSPRSMTTQTASLTIQAAVSTTTILGTFVQFSHKNSPS